MKQMLRMVVVGALALAPSGVWAAIDGSHHDMTVYDAASGETKKCAFCHAITGITASYSGYGQTGTFCVAVCHEGSVSGFTGSTPGATGIMSDGTAANRWATQAGVPGIANVSFGDAAGSSHGEVIGVIPSPDRAADVGATGWPHTSGTTMECTSCHAVHDSTNPPFLNGLISGATNAASFCQRCHAGSDGAGAGRWVGIAGFGPHPVEFPFVNGASDRSATAGKDTRQMEVKAPILRTALKAAYTGRAQLDADVSGNAWRTGGHFIDPATDLPVFGAATSAALVGMQFGCYSCHSAHQNNAGLSADLILGSINEALDTGSTSNFCTACHGATATPNNPGTSLYYHPVNEETTSADGTTFGHDHTTHAGVGSFPIVVDNAGWVYQGSANSEVVCASCHAVHGGIAGQMAIREIDTTIQVTNGDDVCFACHQASMPQPTVATAANYHHPGLDDANSDYTGAENFPAALGWTYTGGYGDLSDGLSCPDCHIFQANGTSRATAHNW
ncbi:MAG: cytochrome c3 family protein [Deferrisomatales bacterium]|nr:cytochrome c3 family protein [Deferrisomatales bacterium]